MRSLLLLLLAACSRPAPWPSFPKDDAARDALVKARTLRPTEPASDYSAEHVFAVAEQLGWQTLPAGEHRVQQWITQQNPKWLLVGTFHDSAGQIDEFRHLARGFDAVAIEQLRAPGRWRDFDGDQRGDDFADLERSHREHDYAAWKYGYERNVLELVTALHALPCDARHTRDDRLRELHCLFSLRDVLEPKARVAMLWGEDHVAREGFRRFLPPEDKTLSLFLHGARWSIDDLRERLLLDDQVLVPLGEGEAALLLPNGHVQRARSDPGGKPLLRAYATVPGTLRIGERSVALTEEETAIELPAGEYTYAFESPVRIVGSIRISGDTELVFDPVSRQTSQLISP